jgi:hypothetical protein
LDGGYRSSHLQGMRWCNTSHTSRRWAHLGTKYRNCIGLAGRPSCTTNLIHDFTIVPCCGKGKVYVFLGTTRENRCSLEHAIHKRQASVRCRTKSARRRFQNQVVSYLEHHLTTWPHETLGVHVGHSTLKCQRYEKMGQEI